MILSSEAAEGGLQSDFGIDVVWYSFVSRESGKTCSRGERGESRCRIEEVTAMVFGSFGLV